MIDLEVLAERNRDRARAFLSAKSSRRGGNTADAVALRKECGGVFQRRGRGVGGFRVFQFSYCFFF